MNRRKEKYVINELLRELEHEVLRLPPYHCEINAIEFILVKAEGYNDHIGRDGYTNDKVIAIWKEALETCDKDIWSNCIRRTKTIIEEWYEQEQYRINCVSSVNRMIIEGNNCSSSSSDNNSNASDSP